MRSSKAGQTASRKEECRMDRKRPLHPSPLVKTLADAGFDVTFEGETTNSTVTAQDPKYGVSVEADSEVKITLTKKEAAEETAEEPKKTTQ